MIERWCDVNPIFEGRVVVIAVTLALGLAIGGTVLGARLHSEFGFAGESGRPVYAAYGWPWTWKTNAPESLIAYHNDQVDDAGSGSILGDLSAWPEHGVRIFVFLATTAMWFLAALTFESVVWWLGRRLRGRWPARSGTMGTVQ
jgi:hypothetical protein